MATTAVWFGLLLAVKAVALWAVAKLVYNVYFHPLRRYPGPLLARATRLYHVYYDVRGVSVWHVKAWHEKYGPVVRIAPDELSFTDSQAWPAIYGLETPLLFPPFSHHVVYSDFGPGFPNKDGTGNFEKDAKWWSKSVNGVLNILDADDEGHKRMRRLQNPAFSDKALRAQESVLGGYADLLIHKLRGLAGPGNPGPEGPEGPPPPAAVDMVAWYNFATFDIIGDLAFGAPFYCLRDAVWHWWLSAVFELFQDGVFLRATRRFPRPLADLLAWLCIPPQLVKTRMDQFMFTVERVNERLGQRTERPDFSEFLCPTVCPDSWTAVLMTRPVSYILKVEGEKGMSLEETYVCAQVLIVAGSETTATALTGATYLLLENPDALRRLTGEIRGRFESEGDITIQSTAELPYLGAVVQESLRLFPPGPAVFPRVVPAGGRTVCGHSVPEGVTVGVHQLSANRSARNFAQPGDFVPERWLDDPRFDKDDKAACQPFSFGPRNCIGKK